MAASHTIDSLIAAGNDCEVKYVGKYNIYIYNKTTFRNSRCWNDNSWKGCSSWNGKFLQWIFQVECSFLRGMCFPVLNSKFTELNYQHFWNFVIIWNCKLSKVSGFYFFCFYDFSGFYLFLIFWIFWILIVLFFLDSISFLVF